MSDKESGIQPISCILMMNRLINELPPLKKVKNLLGNLLCLLMTRQKFGK